MKIQGASGLFTDTRAIGADWRFVGEEMKVAANPFLNPMDRMSAGVLGLGVTAVQLANNQITKTEAAVDAAFGVIGFMGPIGATISATYFVGKLGYEYFSGETLFEKPEQR